MDGPLLKNHPSRPEGGPPQMEPRGGDETDHRPLDEALLECFHEQLPRARRGDAFAPEVVLDFVRSITELQGDDFKDRLMQSRPLRQTSFQTVLGQPVRPSQDKHILDASLEALECQDAPVLLPLVVGGPRGASDTAVAAMSAGWSSWKQGATPRTELERRSVEDAHRRHRLSQSSEGELERAVIAEALKDIEKHLEPSTTQETTESSRPSELEELMEGSSQDTTTEAESSSAPGETEDASNRKSSATSTTEESTQTAAAQHEETSSSEDSYANERSQYEVFDFRPSFDMFSTPHSSLDPVVDNAEPLYAMQSIYHDILQSYNAIVDPQGAGQQCLDVAMGRENPTGAPASYGFANHDFLTQHEEIPGGPFDGFLSSSHQSVGAPQQDSPLDLLCGDNIQFQMAPKLSPFELPLNPGPQLSGPQQECTNSGSVLPSVDEKSFINFLFSHMSSEDVEDNASPLDLFQINSNVAFLPPDNADDVFGHAVIDYNNNTASVLGFHDGRGYQDLTTIEEADRHAEVAAEIDAANRPHVLSDASEETPSMKLAEASRATSPEPQMQLPTPLEEKDKSLATTEVYQVDVSNTIPEFLRSLQAKSDDAEKSGHRRPQDIGAPTEPERNYDLLKSPPQPCVWARARTPFSDGNVLAPTAMYEEARKFRRRNARNFFSDGTATAAPSNALYTKDPGELSSRTTSWPLRPLSEREDDLARQCAPLKPFFVRDQRYARTSTSQRPFFMRQQQAVDWAPTDTTFTHERELANAGSETLAKGHQLLADAPGNDQLGTEDIVTGLHEDRVKPLLSESGVSEHDKGSGANDTGFGNVGLCTCSSEESSKTATTSSNATEDTSSAFSAAFTPPRRTVYYASNHAACYNEQAPSEPQGERAPASGGPMSWSLHSEVPVSLAVDDIKFDATSPLFPDCAPSRSNEAADAQKSGFNEVYPKSSAKRVLSFRCAMPKISEEDFD